MIGTPSLATVRRLWRKARGKDPKYLAWKVFDRLAKKGRRYTRSFASRGLSEARIAGAFCRTGLEHSGSETVRRHFLCGRRPRFFFDPDQVPLLFERLQSQEPGYWDRLLETADHVCDHRLPILAAGEMDLGETIDWSRDYRSGRSWDRKYFADYDFFDMDRPSDVRVAWELNRLHFLVDLGKAYRLSGEEKYARKLKDLIAEWDRANPWASSINWTCPMDVGIRAVNLIWALAFALPSDQIDDPFLIRLARLLLQHGRFIRQNLEYSDIRQNHYLSNLVGLIYIGTFLPEFREAREWLAFAAPRLDQEIFHQVYPDGVGHEGSIPYHRLLTELFTSAALLLMRNDRTPSPEFLGRLEKMHEFVQGYLKPDGTAPLFGDNDDGRLHVLGAQPLHDHRYLLSTGAALFHRADFKEAAGTFWEESAWLTGTEGWTRFDDVKVTHQPPSSRAFLEGGFFVLRHAGDYVLIDCGDVGLRGRGGHGHCDILSFEAVLGAEELVVDRGTSQYTANPSLRRELIRAAGHNTLLVDGVDYASSPDYDIPFVLNTRGKLLSWKPSDRGGVFEGEHYGYRDAQFPFVHRRTVELDGLQHSILLSDELQGEGEHTLTAHFYLASGCSVQVEEKVCRILTPKGRRIRLEVRSSGQGEWETSSTTLFPRYGVQEASILVKWNERATLPETIQFRFECLSPPPEKA